MSTSQMTNSNQTSQNGTHITSTITFSQMLLRLQEFWDKNGCTILQPQDIPAGAGTFHKATFLNALGEKPYSSAYVAPSRRPTDGRYGDNPNRLGHYYQFQVVIKPSVSNIQELYLKSLEHININTKKHDIRFVEDNWKSPTLGAWGLGWEVWLDGMEVTQFTYFQQIGGLPCNPITVEITYGCERLAMYLQDKENVYDILWDHHGTTYGDIHKKSEYEYSKYNFEIADTNMLFKWFEASLQEAKTCLQNNISIVAYEHTVLASHIFNILDARKAISTLQRQKHILDIQNLSKECALTYLK